MSKTLRKSMKEIRLEERLLGFEECLQLFEAAWRKEVWNQNALKTGIEVKVALWPVIREAQEKMQPISDQYHSLRMKRSSK